MYHKEGEATQVYQKEIINNIPSLKMNNRDRFKNEFQLFISMRYPYVAILPQVQVIFNGYCSSIDQLDLNL